VRLGFEQHEERLRHDHVPHPGGAHNQDSLGLLGNIIIRLKLFIRLRLLARALASDHGILGHGIHSIAGFADQTALVAGVRLFIGHVSPPASQADSLVRKRISPPFYGLRSRTGNARQPA
jgi:hypothetical protein